MNKFLNRTPSTCTRSQFIEQPTPLGELLPHISPRFTRETNPQSIEMSSKAETYTTSRDSLALRIFFNKRHEIDQNVKQIALGAGYAKWNQDD